jgi:hypothetical protein
MAARVALTFGATLVRPARPDPPIRTTGRDGSQRAGRRSRSKTATYRWLDDHETRRDARGQSRDHLRRSLEFKNIFSSVHADGTADFTALVECTTPMGWAVPVMEGIMFGVLVVVISRLDFRSSVYPRNLAIHATLHLERQF